MSVQVLGCCQLYTDVEAEDNVVYLLVVALLEEDLELP